MLLLVPVSLVLGALTEPCEVEHGIHYIGNTISSKPSKSVTDCCVMCNNNDLCQFWSFELMSANHTCFLKSSDGGRIASTEHASGASQGLSFTKLTQPAEPILLGLDFYQKGVEAIRDTINRSAHIRLPVYTWNFDQKKSWYNPATQLTYAIPDELSFTSNPAGYEEIDSSYTEEFTQSITELTRSTSFSVGVGINFANVGIGVNYSDNKQWYHYAEEQHEKENYVSHSIMWWRFYELQAYPMSLLGDNSLDPIFKGYCTTKLPSSIKTKADSDAYDFLITNWGTHFVSWANYGGKINLDVFTDKAFNEARSQTWTSDQHSLSFHFNLYALDASATIAGFTNKSQIHVNQSFLQHSRTYLYYEGGEPTLMDEDTLKPWLDSVNSQPHWLNVTLDPLWTLPFLSKPVAATMQNQIEAYFKKASGKGPPAPTPPAQLWYCDDKKKTCEKGSTGVSDKQMCENSCK